MQKIEYNQLIYLRFLCSKKIIFLFLLFLHHAVFAQDARLAVDTLANLHQNLFLANLNVMKDNYSQGKNKTESAIEDLTLLSKLFQPLLERLKQLKKDSQDNLQDISRQQHPQQTEDILQNTKKALQESKQEGQKNEKVTNYIEQAKKLQEMKNKSLAEQNWEKSQDLENRNINALQKAIKELEKQNAQGQGQQGQNNADQAKQNLIQSQEAAAKLSQIKREQKKTKQDRQKIYGKRRNQKRRVPVNRDW